MFGLLRKSPLKQLQKDHEALLTRAFQAQRTSDIRLYSTLTEEAEALRANIEAFKSSEDTGK